MATSFRVRQFFTIPSEYGTFTAPAGTFVVTGSISRLLVNNTRTNLANDSMSIITQNSSPYAATSASPQGWWPSPNMDGTSGVEYGIIVGGKDTYANTSPDGRTSNVSCWGFPEGGVTTEDQEALNALFAELASSVLGVFQPTAEDAAIALRTAGFYYQFPTGFNGQSPNTGTGSDV
jgi:hypothetical protein